MGWSKDKLVVITEFETKVIDDVNFQLEVALAWATSAKNPLHSIHGFSSNQLVFARNINILSVLHEKLLLLKARQPVRL